MWKFRESWTSSNGTSITPDVLYGVPLHKLTSPTTTSYSVVGNSSYGATSQSRKIDNRMEYKFCIQEKHSPDEDGAYIAQSNDSYFYIPSLIMEAKIFYNATNSIGKIYEKSYSPPDGLFFKYNNAFYNPGYMPRVFGPSHDIELNTGFMRQTNFVE